MSALPQTQFYDICITLQHLHFDEYLDSPALKELGSASQQCREWLFDKINCNTWTLYKEDEENLLYKPRRIVFRDFSYQVNKYMRSYLVCYSLEQMAFCANEMFEARTIAREVHFVVRSAH